MSVLVRLFDAIEAGWSSRAGAAARTVVLVGVLVLGMAAVELSRLGLVTAVGAFSIPTNHLYAIAWAITVLLLFEVVDLTFGLARSVASMLGRQLQVIALVLLRRTFEALPELGEPIEVDGHVGSVALMVSDAVGAAAVFGIYLVFRRLQHHMPISLDERVRARFVRWKKVLALLLTVIFAALLVGAAFGRVEEPLASFFTVLIFADVLLAILASGLSGNTDITFRNFGFAAVAVLLRLSLSAHPPLDVVIALLAGGLALAFTTLYNLSPSAAALRSGRGLMETEDSRLAPGRPQEQRP